MLNKQIQEEKDQQEPIQLNWKLWVGLGALSMTGLFSFFLLFIMGEFIGVIPLFATLILGAFSSVATSVILAKQNERSGWLS